MAAKQLIVPLEELQTSIQYDFGDGLGCLMPGRCYNVDTPFAEHLLESGKALTPADYETLQRINAGASAAPAHAPAPPQPASPPPAPAPPADTAAPASPATTADTGKGAAK